MSDDNTLTIPADTVPGRYVIVARASYQYSCLEYTDGTKIATIRVVGSSAVGDIPNPPQAEGSKCYTYFDETTLGSCRVFQGGRPGNAWFDGSYEGQTCEERSRWWSAQVWHQCMKDSGFPYPGNNVVWLRDDAFYLTAWSSAPSHAPSLSPITSRPSMHPSIVPSSTPSAQPTTTTIEPSLSPITSRPSMHPSIVPSSTPTVRFALIDGAPGGGDKVPEIFNPDPNQDLGEVQCCHPVERCTRMDPWNSLSNRDCISGNADNVTYSLHEAISMCEALGNDWTLCTREEVNSDMCRHRGCSHDHHHVWVWDPNASPDPASPCEPSHEWREICDDCRCETSDLISEFAESIDTIDACKAYAENHGYDNFSFKTENVVWVMKYGVLTQRRMTAGRLTNSLWKSAH
eukprot:UN03915